MPWLLALHSVQLYQCSATSSHPHCCSIDHTRPACMGAKKFQCVDISKQSQKLTIVLSVEMESSLGAFESNLTPNIISVNEVIWCK